MAQASQDDRAALQDVKQLGLWTGLVSLGYVFWVVGCMEMVERLPVPLILHICGRTLDRMEYIARTGLAAFHYDSKNPPAEAMAIVKDRIALVGNINNPDTLFAKGPEAVRAEVYANLDAGVPLVGPECAIPLQTAIENLKEIPRAVQDWSREQLASRQ